MQLSTMKPLKGSVCVNIYILIHLHENNVWKINYVLEDLRGTHLFCVY